MEKSELWDALFQKANKSLDTYRRKMWGLAPSHVMGKAEEIAAMNLCYNELVGNMKSYPQEQLEYLLRFEDPLAVMRDQWLQEQDEDHSEQFAHALWSVWSQEAAELEYPLDPAYGKQTGHDGPAMTQEF